jgi:hypothetical protein
MMKHSVLIIVLLLCLAGMMTGCNAAEEASSETAPEGLSIIGDVANYGDVTACWETLAKENIVFDANSYMAVKAEDLLAAFQPQETPVEIALIADDGFMVKLPYDSIQETYFGYREAYGWCYLSEKHPVNARIKHLREVVVIADCGDSYGETGLNLVTTHENVHLSLGTILAGSYESLAYLDGKSNLNGLAIEVMKRKKCLRLSNVLKEAGMSQTVSTLLIIDSDGNHYYRQVTDSYFEVENQQINYISSDQTEMIRKIRGVIINPPLTSNRDNFADSMHYLEKGQKVITLFLDGFSYTQYEAIAAAHPEWFLSQLESVTMATTVYKPVTNAGFATMITGEVPAVNGVFDRSYRELHCETIFDRVKVMGLTSALIEGDIKILDIDAKTYLNTDDDGDGYTDDEVFDRALQLLESGEQPDYLLVHFHGIDDSGHDSGRFSDATMRRIELVDSYAAQLIGAMAPRTKVIITADHGMHDTVDGGDHGDFRYEDLIVPYAIY